MKKAWTTEQFIKRSREVWGDKFDYSLVEYTGMINKVTIICPHHGKFSQKAGGHVDGKDCAKCARLASERYIFNHLK